MSTLKVHLDWYKDSKGYCVNDYGKHGRTIVGKGGKLIPTQPLLNDMVFMAFAKVTSQPELLEFVRQYGLLERPSYGNANGKVAVNAKTLALIESRRVIYGEDIDDHLDTAQRFRDLLAFKSRSGRASDALSNWITERMLDEKLGDMHLEFVSGRGFQMLLKADSLINGMLMQLAQKISGQANFQSCELCGAPFEVGPGTGRRAGATFSSHEHKVEYFSRKRSKGHRQAS